MSRLGWVQFDRARQAGDAGTGRREWGGDERSAHRSAGGPAPHAHRAGRSRRKVMRQAWSVMLIALVAATIVSRFV